MTSQYGKGDRRAQETTYPTGPRPPIKMMRVMPGLAVPLRPEPLDPKVVAPALKRGGASLNAADGFRAGHQRHFRVPDAGVAARGVAVVGHGGRLEEGLAFVFASYVSVNVYYIHKI